MALRNLSLTAAKESELYDNIEGDPEYEIPDKYRPAYDDVIILQPSLLNPKPPSSGGQYELTQCPAYVPVVHSNQPAESSPTQQPASSGDVTTSGDVSTSAGVYDN